MNKIQLTNQYPDGDGLMEVEIRKVESKSVHPTSIKFHSLKEK